MVWDLSWVKLLENVWWTGGKTKEETLLKNIETFSVFIEAVLEKPIVFDNVVGMLFIVFLLENESGKLQ